jgi:hypothetical protein
MKELFQLQNHPPELEKANRGVGSELNQEVVIAFRTKIGPQGGAKK